jgi:hypothetical protein
LISKPRTEISWRGAFTVRLFSDEGFQPVSNWAEFLLKEEWADPGAGQGAANATQMAEFLEQEGYAHPRNSYNRQMRNLLEQIYHDPTTFYSGNLAATIAAELKVTIP